MNDVPGGPDGRPEPSKDFVQGKPATYGGQAPKADWRQYLPGHDPHELCGAR